MTKQIKNYPTQKELKDLFHYDNGGYLRWAVSKQGTKGKDSIAGSPHPKRGYWTTVINYNKYQTSRLIWIYHNGSINPNMEIDHIDRNNQNNQIENLRLVTRSQNGHNRSCQSNNTSGSTGVYFEKKSNKWIAQIWKENTHYYLGSHITRQEAEIAYTAYKQKFMEIV